MGIEPCGFDISFEIFINLFDASRGAGHKRMIVNATSSIPALGNGIFNIFIYSLSGNEARVRR